MTRRLRSIKQRVELLHDGDLLEAEAGEPLAFSLIAAGRDTLSRSPKLHRPRGPYCLHAACDGCLLRVDGVPNVMGCQHRVRGGETVETQNVLGSREVDLLSVTDFLFPHGIDHHRLLAGVRGVSTLVQGAARRIAGLGRLPDAPAEPLPGSREQVEVLVIGGGRAGLTAAAKFGDAALLVEEQAAFGGALALLDPAAATLLIEHAAAMGAELRSATCAAGAYRETDDAPLEVLLISERGASLVTPRRLVIAMGGHARVPRFANNDLPGLYSARAGLALLRAGISPGDHVAVVGEGAFAEAAAELLGDKLALRVLDAAVVMAATGRAHVKGLRLASAGAEQDHAVDAVLFDAPEAPAFELLVQAGGSTRFDADRGYVPDVDDDGRAARDVFAVGRVTGTVTAEWKTGGVSSRP